MKEIRYAVQVRKETKWVTLNVFPVRGQADFVMLHYPRPAALRIRKKTYINGVATN